MSVQPRLLEQLCSLLPSSVSTEARDACRLINTGTDPVKGSLWLSKLAAESGNAEAVRIARQVGDQVRS